MHGFEIQPVTLDRWPDMVELFERRGPRGGHRNTPAYGCWCMYWRDRSVPRARGAAAVEAYPHVGDPRDYMGGVDLYRRAGFRHARDANKRAVVRLETARR